MKFIVGVLVFLVLIGIFVGVIIAIFKFLYFLVNTIFGKNTDSKAYVDSKDSQIKDLQKQNKDLKDTINRLEDYLQWKKDNIDSKKI
ncbi:hypothetical protein DCO58_02045 [Helicobacter saguini]|uniref:BZIP transcription factor n=1 Tax=Helicobacter saguini TaxID=1548018 RepID=A0A347VRN0_9HELI|nr:bZIP transcription factor [Helicobacter saguini]MWV62843.1 hypothetical protein [Helicobacter saguini]MWV66488.1 hypothetical protein [Helicobacter saguini]MWV68837.1 hypothetical protein [Helicobacter saguini]MWV71608.1 hypothetical protein [Helicobacter saguini]TLD94412.1 bZIP transcription factor [Helicobacter saguini]